MRELFRILSRMRSSSVKILIVDPSHPDEAHNTEIVPERLFRSLLIVLFGVIGILATILYITPLGNAIYYREDPQIAESIYDLSNRIMALRDTLQLREYEMDKMKSIMTQDSDTLFELNEGLVPVAVADETAILDSLNMYDPVEEVVSFGSENSFSEFELSDNNLLLIDQLSEERSIVPFSKPIEGSISRVYNEAENHFGMDIATESGEFIRAIADGTIIQSQWTWNYGHVVVIQHQEGYISVYKHLNQSYRVEGELALRGSVIGLSSDVGLISTGPHLHLEIWKDGIPIDPSTTIQ